MTTTHPELAIITLTRDNTAELELTLRSVRLQTSPPTRHIVIDASSGLNAEIAAGLAQEAGAEYMWREARGIYEAMDFSVSLLSDREYVMWLNSSDWLAGNRVLERVFSELKNLDDGTDWIIGQLLRRGNKEVGFHKGLWSVHEFPRLMELGFTGFPHPSTVFSARAVKQVGGFRKGARFHVARDYDLALRVLAQFGSPRVLSAIFSVHVPQGFSSRMQRKGFLERLESRLIRLSLAKRIRALLFAPLVLAFAIYRKVFMGKTFNPEQLPIDAILGHYCSEGLDINWPHCCDSKLGVGAAYPDLTRLPHE